MPRLAPECIVEIACGTPERREFERQVLELLERTIGADVSFFCSSSALSEVTRGLNPEVRPAAQSRWSEMTREVGLLLPAARRSGGVVVDSEVLGKELEQLVYYDVFMRPHRGRTTLMGWLECHGHSVGKVVLGRNAGSSDFRGQDVACLRALLPTLSLSQHNYLRTAPPARVAPRQPSGSPARLSVREREVLSYLHLGYTNQQIAVALGSAPRTVRNQLSRVYEKLGVGSRAEAVAVSFGSLTT